MEWMNEPNSWSLEGSDIVVRPDPQTDFWRITEYGYVRDNAHIYGTSFQSDFNLSVRIRAEYAEQYDQAGAAVWVDECRWIKTGVELFNGRLRFSTVVTADNSSWVFSDLPLDFGALNLSLVRRGDAIRISQSTDNDALELASVVYAEPGSAAFAGVMCAAPTGNGFSARFSEFELSAC
jgi:uncharacterized protein